MYIYNNYMYIYNNYICIYIYIYNNYMYIYIIYLHLLPVLQYLKAIINYDSVVLLESDHQAVQECLQEFQVWRPHCRQAVNRTVSDIKSIIVMISRLA